MVKLGVLYMKKETMKDILIYIGLGIAVILVCVMSSNSYNKQVEKCVNGGNTLSYCQANLK